MKIKPVFDYVLILPEDMPEKSAGGIVLPKGSHAEEPTYKATVIDVGPGRYSKDGQWLGMCCKVGDHVLYRPYGMKDLKIDGIKHVIINQQEILGIIE